MYKMIPTGRLIVWAGLIVVFNVEVSNSRSSTLWRLDEDQGLIKSVDGHPRFKRYTSAGNNTPPDQSPLQADAKHAPVPNDGVLGVDVIFDIITAPTVTSVSENGTATWTLHGAHQSGYASGAPGLSQDGPIGFGTENLFDAVTLTPDTKLPHIKEEPTTLCCGKPAYLTQYDGLNGIAQRFKHPISPDPEVAFIFMKRKNGKFDIAALERRLRKALGDNPRSASLYNQIGNYWRIKGDTAQAIECFRNAIAIRPTNAEVLLNMAQVLLHQKYLDDAIHLARKSLELHKSDQTAWRQYLTLGEIFKAYGHFHASIVHLRHAHKLHPNHELITRLLREVESMPKGIMHSYTACIVVGVVLSTIAAILMKGDRQFDWMFILKWFLIDRPRRFFNGDHFEAAAEPKRHFNRAMAMRSLKGFARTPRISRK